MADMESFIPPPDLISEHTKRGFTDNPVAMFDHVFPEREIAILDASGKATWYFRRGYADKLVITYFVFKTAGSTQPVVVEGDEWILDANGKYIGVKIQGYRGQDKPLLTTTVVAVSVAIGNQSVKAFGAAAGDSLSGTEVHLQAGVKA